jgi:hypothetical protein
MGAGISIYAGDDQTRLARTGEYKFNALALCNRRRWLRPQSPSGLVGGISIPTWNSIARMQTQLRIKPETVLSSSWILISELTGRRKGKERQRPDADASSTRPAAIPAVSLLTSVGAFMR